jgi:hypothetical protein
LTAVGSSIVSVFRKGPTPYSEQESADLQYEFPKKWLVDVGYVGTTGQQLTRVLYLNQLPNKYLALGNQLQNKVPNPFYNQGVASGAESGSTIQQNYLLTPFPQYTGIGVTYMPGAFSSYNSLQASVLHQYDQHLSVRVAYTWSKFLDDFSPAGSNNSGNGTSQDATNLHSDYSLSMADVPQNLVAAAIFKLPFGRGERLGSSWNRGIDAILGGWSLNTIYSLSSGTPLSLSATNNNNNFGPGERPNWNGTDPRLHGRSEDRLKKYFNTSVYSQPAPYTYGNTGRAIPQLRLPRTDNDDLSLFKTFTLYRELQSQLRLEAFNALNHPVFGGPGTGVTGSSFGVVSSQTNNPRQLQIALKILF